MAARPRDVVVIGASAGGVEALRALVARLPPDLNASILVVLHMPADGTTALSAILKRSGPLHAVTARHGDRLEHGRIYVARPDHHLLVMDGGIGLSHGPTENGHRPAINALFRSAAVAKGASVTGVLLSGVLDDGVAGLHAIAARGGRVVVQDPSDALYPSMPEHALRSLKPDHVVAADEMGEVLAKITTEYTDTPDQAVPEMLRWENEIAGGMGHLQAAAEVGIPSEFSCPDCQGVLVELGDQRFRCRVGHAWTAEAMLAAQGSELERALWTAQRTLEEKATLSQRMAGRARDRGNHNIAQRYELQADEARTAADTIRRMVTGENQSGTTDPDD